jgi:hypothetical protein
MKGTKKNLLVVRLCAYLLIFPPMESSSLTPIAFSFPNSLVSPPLQNRQVTQDLLQNLLFYYIMGDESVP